MKLVIAEKPSVGMAYAAVLGAKKRMDGYMEGGGWLVSWCFGHLVELAGAETYDERYAKWNRADLPIVPDPWRMKVAHAKKKQFTILKALMEREDVTEIVNGCDAGREGEAIFRYVYEQAGCRKPMKRLWLSSMEDDAIIDAFSHLHDGAEFDRLYDAALCRAKADWLVGINATRLFSVLYHRTLNVGRVVSPTLALIAHRDAEIRAFQPERYYTASLTFPDFAAVSEKFKDKADADAALAACESQSAVVTRLERKEKREKAPALYDLTTLQRDANRLLSYTAQQTLDYLQALYEKKLCTYPRTDSRFLTDDMLPSVPAIVSCAGGICGAGLPASMHPAQVCDSKKVSDHHALLPTIRAGEADFDALPIGECEVLKLLCRQVLIAVSGEYVCADTVAEITCSGYVFNAKGKIVLDAGWKTYLNQPEEKPLPDLVEGALLPVPAGEVTEGKTKPPAAYSEDTLLHAMETAGGKDMPEDAERKGIGTPATRAAMIEKLVAGGFVERKKGGKAVSLVPVQAGVSLVTILPEQLQSPLLTAEWEHKLGSIERGELSPEAFLAEITQMVQTLVSEYQPVPGAEVLFPSGREVVGNCPRCGSDVTESKKGFFCEKSNCRFGLWRDNKFLTAKRISLTKLDVTALLRTGRVRIKNIYSERTGKTFDADLLLDDNGERTVYRFDFGRERTT